MCSCDEMETETGGFLCVPVLRWRMSGSSQEAVLAAVNTRLILKQGGRTDS